MTAEARIALLDWMIAPETRAVVAALQAGGADVRFVGGCVRDAVAGRPVKDIDLATPLPPERVQELVEAAGLKAVPTGLAHGTVTAVSGGRPYEITTLRVDIEPLGRHAKVEFTDDWLADAARRDFTFNAMSCDPEGRLFDPFEGHDDLTAGRVRFVGEARRRIEEDHLRLLRFFRFHAHYGRGPLDGEGLAAAAESAPLLAKLSGERIRNELLKLLEAADPVPVLTVMIERRVLAAVLPEIADSARLAALLPLEPSPDPLRRLAALLAPDPDLARTVGERLRLSNAESARLTILADLPRDEAWREPRPLRRLLYALGSEAVSDLLRLDQARRLAANDSPGAERFEAALAVAESWQAVAFPLKGRDVTALGVPDGPEIGRLLRVVKSWWMDQDFAPDREACLAELQALVEKAG